MYRSGDCTLEMSRNIFFSSWVPRRQGQEGALAPPLRPHPGKDVKCLVHDIKTLSRRINYALFSKPLSAYPRPLSGIRLWTPLGNVSPRPPKLPTPKKSCGRPCFSPISSNSQSFINIPIPNPRFSLALFPFPSHSHWLFPFPSHSQWFPFPPTRIPVLLVVSHQITNGQYTQQCTERYCIKITRTSRNTHAVSTQATGV